MSRYIHTHAISALTFGQSRLSFFVINICIWMNLVSNFQTHLGLLKSGECFLARTSNFVLKSGKWLVTYTYIECCVEILNTIRLVKIREWILIHTWVLSTLAAEYTRFYHLQITNVCIWMNFVSNISNTLRYVRIQKSCGYKSSSS